MQVRVVQAQNEIYIRERLLGEGAFGKAYLVRKKQNNEYLVIKEVSIDHMSQQEREETIKQAQILRNFNHPLIVKFVQVYATKQNKLKIVMEYAECGDLSKAIASKKAQKQSFEENQILDWFTQICLAMKHVHDRKILHRDIKGQNIFITKTNTLKLGDFGIARVLNKTQDKARTVVGTPYYLSPEIIENKPYSFKSDIWSMGVLLYELCALAPPFTANSLQFLALKIVKGSYTALTGNYSKELKGLVHEILQNDPNKRPSVGDILKKPFIQERIRKYLSESYRVDEFSHTVLHNHKVVIANKLVKVQDKAQGKAPMLIQEDKQSEQERIRLKEEAAILKEKLERKKEEERMREEERLRRKRDEEYQRRGEEQQRRREQQARNKEIQQKRAAEQRRLWVQREKKKQEEQNRNYQEQERRRVMQVAEMAKRRDRQQQELLNKKQKLLREKYELERGRAQQLEMKKGQKVKDEKNKIEQLNEFARKQWYENQMIKKRAEERAKQSELDSYYSQPSHQEYEEPKPPQRQQSSKQTSSSSNQRRSVEKKPVNNADYAPKRQSLVYEPSEEQLQNAMLNPNFNKKTPSSAKTKQPDVKPPPNVSNYNSKPKEEIKPKEDKSKKSYDDAREQMKKDREEFAKNKNTGNKPTQQSPIVQTLKPGKWDKKANKSTQKDKEQPKSINSPPKVHKQAPQESIMQSEELRLNIKDEQQFNDYLKELEGLLANVNKNMEKIDPLPEMPVVEQKIILREDDTETFEYSMTASFQNILEPPNLNADNADFDYFSNYSKLQDLRMGLQDKFGTDNFIRIYRTLQSQLQAKGLQNFNLIEVMTTLGASFDVNLITQNLPLLLTLIIMQQKMSSS